MVDRADQHWPVLGLGATVDVATIEPAALTGDQLPGSVPVVSGFVRAGANDSSTRLLEAPAAQQDPEQADRNVENEEHTRAAPSVDINNRGQQAPATSASQSAEATFPTAVETGALAGPMGGLEAATSAGADIPTRTQKDATALKLLNRKGQLDPQKPVTGSGDAKPSPVKPQSGSDTERRGEKRARCAS